MTEPTYIAHGTDENGNLWTYQFESFNEAYDFVKAANEDEVLDVEFEAVIVAHVDTAASALADLREMKGVEV